MPDSINLKEEPSKRIRESNFKEIFDKVNKTDHMEAEVFQIDINIDQLINS